MKRISPILFLVSDVVIDVQKGRFLGLVRTSPKPFT